MRSTMPMRVESKNRDRASSEEDEEKRQRRAENKKQRNDSNNSTTAFVTLARKTATEGRTPKRRSLEGQAV